MPVAIHGAAGHTGRLVESELRSLGAECIPVDGRRGPLSESLRGCEAVANCAPGDPAPVIRAAVQAGAHYADLTHDQAMLRAVFEREGPGAAAAGVTVVPALGFDYALGDFASRLAAAGNEPLRQLVVAYAVEGAGVAGDAAAGGGPGGDEVEYRDGRWQLVPRRIRRTAFRFPPPLGRQVVQRYGSGEVLTVPRHTRTRSVVTLITASTWSPHPALTPFVPYLRPLAARLRRGPLAPLLRRLARGGSDERDAEDRFTIAVLAQGEDGRAGRVIVRGSGFRELTAVVLARGVRMLAGGSVPAAGALPPAAAFDPTAFLDSLADRGVSWEQA